MTRTPEDIAWAAGLFEGEGCVTISTVDGRKYLLASVSMHPRDRDVLERFHRIVGVGTLCGPHKNGMCRWAGHGSRLRPLLEDEEFVRHLGARRRARIEECLGIVDSQPAPNSLPRRPYNGGLPRKPRRAIAA